MWSKSFWLAPFFNKQRVNPLFERLANSQLIQVPFTGENDALLPDPLQDGFSFLQT